MSDLPVKLREMADYLGSSDEETMLREAADELDALRSRLKLSDAVCDAAASLKSELDSDESRHRDPLSYNVWFIMCEALETRHQARDAK